MATVTKRKKQTKSAAIRDYMAKNPSAGPTEISKALTKQGIKVSPAHVSNVKSTSSKPKRGRRGRTTTTTDDVVSIVQLVEARRFADRVGGVDKAVELLQSLGRLLA